MKTLKKYKYILFLLILYSCNTEKNNNQSVPKFAIDSFIECFRGYLDVIHIGEYAIIKKKKF